MGLDGDEAEPAASDEERNEANSRGTINDGDFVVDMVSPGDVQDYDHLPLEYNGFCPVALVRYGRNA